MSTCFFPSRITLPPVLHLMYVVQYFPTLSKKLMDLVGKSAIQKLRDSRDTVKED